MNVKLNMDKTLFTGFYKWLNLMSTTVTPECKVYLDSFLQENKAQFEKIEVEEFSLTEKGQGKLVIGDVVKIAKRNIYHDKDAEYVVVQIKEDIDVKKFGLLPIDHILNKEMLEANKTATPWRWFNHYNIRFVRELNATEKELFSQWRLTRKRKKAVKIETPVVAPTLFDGIIEDSAP